MTWNKVKDAGEIDQPELGLGTRVEVGLGNRLISKIGLHTHHPPLTHPPPPQTFLHEGEVLGVGM